MKQAHHLTINPTSIYTQHTNHEQVKKKCQDMKTSNIHIQTSYLVNIMINGNREQNVFNGSMHSY